MLKLTVCTGRAKQLPVYTARPRTQSKQLIATAITSDVICGSDSRRSLKEMWFSHRPVPPPAGGDPSCQPQKGTRCRRQHPRCPCPGRAARAGGRRQRAPGHGAAACRRSPPSSPAGVCLSPRRGFCSARARIFWQARKAEGLRELLPSHRRREARLEQGQRPRTAEDQGPGHEKTRGIRESLKPGAGSGGEESELASC